MFFEKYHLFSSITHTHSHVISMRVLAQKYSSYIGKGKLLDLNHIWTLFHTR